MSKTICTLPATKGQTEHTHLGVPEQESLCGGAVLDSYYAHLPSQREDPPTCPRCHKKWDQLNVSAQIVESEIDHDSEEQPETD